LAGSELDICRQGIEMQWLNVTANEGAELLARAGASLRPDTFEVRRDIVGVPRPVEEVPESLTLDQPGGADGDGREEGQQLLGGAGLQFEELLEIAAVIVRPYRARYRAMDFVETGEPGCWPSHRVTS
jgi:hypothetical protein